MSSGETEEEGASSEDQDEKNTTEERNEAEDHYTFLNSKGVYELGFQIQYLRLATSNNYPFSDSTNPSGSNYILGSLEKITTILDTFERETVVQSDIETTKQALCHDYLSDEDDENDDESDNNGEVYLLEEDRRSLGNSVKTWNRQIREELENASRYAPMDSGLLRITELLESPEMLFGDQQIWDDLPERVQSDLEQSVRSLAFGSPTGSVFIALRAVEDRLGEWYEMETERDIGDRTFGQVISELDDHYDEDEKPPILTHLSYLKDRRNEVAHPDRSPSPREAESTLVSVRETIHNIEEELENGNSSEEDYEQ